MTTRPGSRAPTAVPYAAIPAYGQSRDLHAELMVTARRIGGSRFAVDRLLRQQATSMLLAAAEAGARIAPARRVRFYRAGWFATYDLSGLLDSAETLRLFPPEARLAADAALRMAQQALTIMTGVMVERMDGLPRR